MEKKRTRANNWNEEEKAVFINAAKNHMHIIENKKKCVTTNRMKDEAWRKIQKDMLHEGYVRDINRIKEQWQRMKVQSKTHIRNFKKCTKQTGGGPPPTQPTEIEYQISELIPHEFTDDKNPFDSDNITPSLNDEPVSQVSEENVYIIDQTFRDTELQQETPTPKKSRQTFSNRMTEYESKLYELNKERIQQVMRHAEELHNLKLKNEEEYHRERLNLMKLNPQQ
ncbi:apontic [Carabus blaptoides fortunei]